MTQRAFTLTLVATGWFAVASMAAAATTSERSPEQRGYRFLTEKPYLPPDFDQATFDDVWQEWPEPLRTQAEKASVAERRRLAFARYGLTPRPNDSSGKPLQYVVDEQGHWIMNCFACHSGEVGGQVIPGAPNARFALQTLTEEIRATKIRRETPLSRMDIGSLFMPLGTTNGTTNAVMFGVVLMAFRDPDLSIHTERPVPKMVHHDMDAPPWWHFHKRHHLYIDGFAAKGHRGLMQFMLVKQNGPEKFRQWETDFRDVFAYMESLRPPKYPYPVDGELARTGQAIFNRSCAECHGTYGDRATYPQKLVPIDDIGTDRVRLDALSPQHRQAYGASWFAEYGQQATIADPGGYVAPPLDGVWASAPYLHNGSVPTLWHMLHPADRPTVWRNSAEGYDQEKVGLPAQIFDRVPEDVATAAERRHYFNTRVFGKSAAGHRYPDELSEDEKRAVLEYLKTL